MKERGEHLDRTTYDTGLQTGPNRVQGIVRNRSTSIEFGRSGCGKNASSHGHSRKDSGEAHLSEGDSILRKLGLCKASVPKIRWMLCSSPEGRAVRFILEISYDRVPSFIFEPMILQF